MRKCGVYRDRATIQQDSSTADASQPDYTGAALEASWPCRIHNVSGQERFRGLQLEAGTNYVAEGNWLDGVTPAMRLLVVEAAEATAGAVFGIVYARPMYRDGGRKSLTIFCKELAL